MRAFLLSLLLAFSGAALAENTAETAPASEIPTAEQEFVANINQYSKAQIIERGTALGVDYSQTVTCYQADEEGRACGVCDACRLRRAGFEAAGIADPTRFPRTSRPTARASPRTGRGMARRHRCRRSIRCPP